MNWLILMLFSVLAASGATILQRVLMRDEKSDPYSYAVVLHLLLGLLNLGFGLWYGSDFSLLGGNFLTLLLTALLWAVCNIFALKTLQLLGASEAAILSALGVVVTIVVSVILLQETFGLQKILGAALILVSTLLVANFRQGFKINKGLLYALAMALFAGVGIVVDSVNVRHYDPVAYNTIMNFLIGLIIVAFAPRTLQRWRPLAQADFLKKILFLAIFGTVQSITYLMALTYGGNTAQVGTIRQASVIVTVLLAVIFLHEREHPGRKIAAAILVSLGIVLLS